MVLIYDSTHPNEQTLSEVSFVRICGPYFDRSMAKMVIVSKSVDFSIEKQTGCLCSIGGFKMCGILVSR